MMNNTDTVGRIVADDFRAAAVFERHGIDFCCGGNRAVDEACREAGVDPGALARELETALAQAGRGGAVPSAPFGTVQNPVGMMELEHQSAGEAMDSIRKLSGGYAPPADACTTFKVTYQELSAFEADLHRHVHLENNILFPKALALERAARGSE
jgi:iron-sulfur cluster repair protein YtfE (RIC family)